VHTVRLSSAGYADQHQEDDGRKSVHERLFIERDKINTILANTGSKSGMFFQIGSEFNHHFASFGF
jgi:hypothetical protein